YIPVGMEAYAFVKGGKNPEGVAKFLECKRFVLEDSETLALADKQMKEDYGWTDEMFDMKESMQTLAEANPVIDLSRGVSADCGELLDNSLRLTARGTAWSETYDSINAVVDKYIDEVNSEN
ncbi:MAG: carbohydrate ABC transporter substrate-binding protein, partial [Ruminococcus sp.]|nr:carbohydrate ABC transporter substrate-binding protein [Ruminococcus sp.]